MRLRDRSDGRQGTRQIRRSAVWSHSNWTMQLTTLRVAADRHRRWAEAVMTQGSPDPLLARSGHLVVWTSLVLFGAWVLFDVLSIHVDRSPSEQQAWRVVQSVALVLTPFAVLFAHFQLQRPPRSSIAGAFGTSLSSCALAAGLVFTFGIWLHVQLGGEFI